MQAFKDGPWTPGGPVASGAMKLWGPEGTFNLMPAQVVVAYQPKVVVSLSSSDYSRVVEQTRAGGGFSIGPFGFGASYGKRTEDITFDNASNTITAVDSTDVPQVIAVVSSILPTFE